MSLVSCVEPHRPGEEQDAGQRPDQQHVLQMTEDQERSDEKEMDDTLNAEGEVNKDEHQKENKEVWRKGATQKIHRRRLKQPDGTLAGGLAARYHECVSVVALAIRSLNIDPVRRKQIYYWLV